jgi:hypothetical protein
VEEAATRAHQLSQLFDRYSTKDVMTEAQLQAMCKQCELYQGHALATIDITMIFTSTKVGRKQELKFDRFEEACRKIAVKKSVTFTELTAVAFESMQTIEERAREGGFSAGHAAAVIGAGSVAAKKAAMFQKPGENKAFSAKMASRQRKFGGAQGVESEKGDANGFSTANAKKLAKQGGTVASRAAKFGGGEAKQDNSTQAKETIKKGAVASRMAAFGGPEAAAQAVAEEEEEAAFSAANAAKEIGSGAVAARAALFKQQDQTNEQMSNSEHQRYEEEVEQPPPADMKQRLCDFYTAVNPEGLAKVDKLLEKVKDDPPKKQEKKLNKQFKKAYGISLTEFEAGDPIPEGGAPAEA